MEISDDHDALNILNEIEDPDELAAIEAASKSIVSDLVWIRRGVPKKVPEKINIDLNDKLTIFDNPLEDPHITQTIDSDAEEEKDDFEIRDSDNMVAVSKIVKDDASLEVFIYNEENDDWYLHHDYILEAPALCLAPFNYDPGTDDRKGNLLAVGTMDSVINIWDLDIVNSLVPVLTLGSSQLKGSSKSRAKRDGTAQTHVDSVLCMDWNPISEQALASGSADKTTILWDLDEAKAVTIIKNKEMIQSLQWHPTNKAILLCGSRSGRITLTDCRTLDEYDPPSPLTWKFGKDVEVEKVLWNHFNPHYFFACSTDGHLRYMDSRKPGEVIADVLSHDNGCNSVSQSFQINGLITTVGTKELKVWKLSNDTTLNQLYSHPVNMGKVSVTKFCPDSGTVLAVGAQGEELVRLYDLAKYPEVVEAFNKEDN